MLYVDSERPEYLKYVNIDYHLCKLFLESATDIFVFDLCQGLACLYWLDLNKIIAKIYSTI